jgi:predicted acetyltransferase
MRVRSCVAHHGHEVFNNGRQVCHGHTHPMLTPVLLDDVRLQRLLQLYLHEWSAILPAAVRLTPEALFAVPGFRSDQATLFVHDGVPVGFALTYVDALGVAHIEEFFVVAGLRRRGLGLAAACALFSSPSLSWTLTVRPENSGALRFWRAAMPGAVETLEPGDDGIVRTRLTLR